VQYENRVGFVLVLIVGLLWGAAAAEFSSLWYLIMHGIYSTLLTFKCRGGNEMESRGSKWAVVSGTGIAIPSGIAVAVGTCSM